MICLHTIKWFQVLLLNISNPIVKVFQPNTNNLQTVGFQINTTTTTTTTTTINNDNFYYPL